MVMLVIVIFLVMTGRLQSSTGVKAISTAFQEGITFTKITDGKIVKDIGFSNAASWIDYDNDGFLDMYVVNANDGAHKNFLYRNNGDGSFEKLKKSQIVKSSAATFGSSWADYDNDGDLDVYICGFNSLLYRNDGSGFAKITAGNIGRSGITGFGCAWGDYDNDGNVDLIVANPGIFFRNRESNFLFHNDGPPDYTFTRITSGPIVTGVDNYTVPTWSDFDNDGDLDLFIGNGPADGTTAENRFYQNMLKETGRADFEAITRGIVATDRGDGQVGNWIDYDNDGDLDLYLTNFGAGPSNGLQNALYRNEGGGSFTKITAGSIVTDRDISLASIWGDYDNDGDLDVYVANGADLANRYYQNNGNGSFTRIDRGDFVTERNVSFGASAGDYNNDGFLDIYVANLGSSANRAVNFLYKNDGNSNHWINIKCIGDRSNRAGIGAKVRVLATIDGKQVWQMREISSQDSFCGQNSINVEFGFGGATTIDTIKVEWPSGVIDQFQNVQVDKFITITEGKQ
jgi:enediyne biosynthesis protein E4